MTPYFVIGGVTAAWAVVLTILGLTRENFPSTIGGVRAIIAVTGVLVLATVVTVISVTEAEHPREEAAAAERGEEGPQEQADSEAYEEEPPPSKSAPAPESESEPKSDAGSGSNTVTATETDFKIVLSSGNKVDSGEYTFDVVNDSPTQHDLAIEGEGVDEKTEIIDGGEKSDLKVDLEPGTYKVYCTVAGHAQAGMKLDLDVQ